MQTSVCLGMMGVLHKMSTAAGISTDMQTAKIVQDSTNCKVHTVSADDATHTFSKIWLCSTNMHLQCKAIAELGAFEQHNVTSLPVQSMHQSMHAEHLIGAWHLLQHCQQPCLSI